MDDLVKALQAALGNVWAYYFKAHTFHWNVRGPLFQQFHDMFGAIYGDAFAEVDTLAELILTLDVPAPASLDDIVQSATIAFAAAGDVGMMLVQLAADNAAVIAALDAANTAATAAGKQGIANTLQGLLDAHEKWGWKLRATINAGAAG
ncbi:ferritin-like domain-containing protein [Bradyrhizobium sp. HKCCYLR1051]|uniref:ferritin-like domain-containing protein n=1 Tax=Bradyrhizobium sp. HKCCYLR1051 TaxID=3420738 RepID=UPI003EB8D67A